MTKEEIDELGSMAMKVINDHPLTEAEGERFKELQEKLDGMAESTGMVEEELARAGDGGSGFIDNDTDLQSSVLESGSD
jgi:hypothetical protein